MNDDWDFDTARAALRELVARRAQSPSPAPATTSARMPFRHRAATTAGLAAVASAVVVGTWWAAGGPITSTAVTAETRSAPSTGPRTPGLIPDLATVGPLQVVEVPASDGRLVPVVVGPATTTATGGAPTSAPRATKVEATSAPEPAAARTPIASLPTATKRGGGGSVTRPPRTTVTIPDPTASRTPSPTSNPPASSTATPPPSTADEPARTKTTDAPSPGTPDGGSGSGARQSGESGR